MSEPKAKEPDYGNWVSMKLIYVFGVAGFLLLGLSSIFLILYVSRAVGVLFLELSFEIYLTSIIGAGLFIFTSVYFAYVRHKFSPQGGNIQVKIQELVLSCLDWDGEGQALDIGCGNAPLTTKMAKKFPNAHVTGIDYWGGAWEYSKSVCERNAAIEGVADRVRFQKASASKLPFEDESFDAAVSNLVFHDVKDAKDKRDVIKEALRVVKKGGEFAFQDLFLDKRVYGEVNDLLEAIRSWGIKSVKFLDTSRSAFIPRALRRRFMVGAIAFLHGTK